MISFKENKDIKKMLIELSKMLDRNNSDIIRKAIEHYYKSIKESVNAK